MHPMQPLARSRYMQLRSALLFTFCALAALASVPAQADTGKLALTGGVSTIEGAAGGGLTPWGVIGTNATEGEWGVSAFASRVKSRDYALRVAGAAMAWNERVELSFAQQRFDTGPTGVALGLPGLVLRQDVLGLKWRVAGDAVLDADTWLPAVSLGLQAKKLHPGGLAPTLAALGAKTSGTDVYVSATKVLLQNGLVLNATLRATKANQTGLLGFGSARQSSYRVQPEVSVASLLRRDLALGFEWRGKPDNLNRVLGAGVLQEDDWADVFVAWAPSKHFSITAAYVHLGRIAPPFVTRRQTGWYVSGQAAF
jgi:Protein of unknown function (DUF3034)